MGGISKRSGGRLIMLVVACMIFGALAGAVARSLLSGSGATVAPVVVGAAGVGVALATAFAGPLFVEWLAEGRTGPILPVLTADQMEGWRAVLRRAVLQRRVRGKGSQLDQMVRQGTAIDVSAEEQIDTGRTGLTRSRLWSEDNTLSWSQITAEWDRTPGRMVLLGDPGYGKTIAALTLLKHINSTEAPKRAVAELFPLVEWYRWHAGHPGGRLSDWLAAQLSSTYAELPLPIATALVDADLVLPLLDGLDEVPDTDRLACKEAIDAYAERSAPFRPFVLTCRVREYAALAPDWVTADRQIRLIGLQADQILSMLEEQTLGRSGWAPIRDRIAEGDRDLIALFRSPMRLATALQSYRNRDAEELGTLNPATAQGQLWERLLAFGSPEFRGADYERIRSWLHFLASGMRRWGRQRFWLHELYLFAPDRPQEFRRFRVQLGLAVRLAVALIFGLVAGMRFGLVFGLAIGLVGGMAGQLAALLAAALPLTSRLKHSRLAWPDARSVASGFVAMLAMLAPTLATALQFVRSFGTIGLTTWLVFGFVALSPGLIVAFIPDLFAGLATGRFVTEAPSVKVTVPWKTRIYALRKDFAAALASGLVVGLVLALVAGLAAQARVGLVFGLAGTLAAGLVAGMGSLLGAGTVSFSSDPPRRLAGRGAAAVLSSARNAGLVTGVTLGLLYGTIVAMAFGLLFGRGAGLAFGLAYGLSAALVLGLAGGVAPWLYYHWLRLRLARRGLLPRRLREFLDWCASQGRGWMRASDAYEFRHPTLVEYLASTPSPQRFPTEGPWRSG